MLNVVILCLKIERWIQYIRILCLLQGQEKKKPEQNLQAGVVIKSTSDRK